jgi:hypothetical protein
MPPEAWLRQLRITAYQANQLLGCVDIAAATAGTWGYVDRAQSDGKKSLEEFAIPHKRDAKVFGRDLVAPVPLLL